MIKRIAPVRTAAAAGTVEATVRRTDHVPERLGLSRTGMQMWMATGGSPS
ncbi:hypothetical protein OHA25_09950 [Nonomuraea sp. NBC_00507]